MNNSKVIGVFIVLAALIGLWLHSKGKLITTGALITAPMSENDRGKLGRFVIAFLVFILVLSFLNPKDGLYLTILVILGALIINKRQQGNNDLIGLILGK